MKLNRILIVLEKNGIKQAWLAKKLDKSYNMVNSYCKNRRQPSIEMLFEIAKLLSVDVRDLLECDHEPLQNEKYQIYCTKCGKILYR